MYLRSIERFWDSHPALLYGLALLLGSACALHFHGSFLLPCFLIWMPLFCKTGSLRGKKRLLGALALFFIFWGYVFVTYQFPHVSKEGRKGTLLFRPESLTVASTPFGKVWRYGGEGWQFYPEENNRAVEKGRGFPCQIMLPYYPKRERPDANAVYALYGTLKVSHFPYYRFKPEKGSRWVPVSQSEKGIEARFRAKRQVKRYIHHVIPLKNAAEFLAGLITGDFDDQALKAEFARFGLQHIMAVSGFHFTIVASCLGIFLRNFFRYKAAAILLMVGLTLYMLFLGSSPSVLRAWIMMMVFLAGYVFERGGISLNALGIALIFCLLWDPLMVYNLGFQFSFLVTGAILMFYPLCRKSIESFLPRRSLGTALKMNRLNQHGYVVLSFFREALALTLAVNAVALPFTLYCFSKFPVMSLIYNLFYPFLVSLSMLFFIAGSATHLFMPWLGMKIHAFNASYTDFILRLTSNMPMSADLYIKTQIFPLVSLLAYLTALFAWGIWMKSREKEMPGYIEAHKIASVST